MSKLWRPDNEIEAARRLSSWGLFHEALGHCGLHTQNEVREYGEWVVPFYSVIRGERHLYRQLVAKGYGPTVVTAMANGLMALADSPLIVMMDSSAPFRAKLAMLDMLLEDRREFVPSRASSRAASNEENTDA